MNEDKGNPLEILDERKKTRCTYERKKQICEALIENMELKSK